jgi:acetyl-CoA carboxylase biotin carboxyl carrier protein
VATDVKAIVDGNVWKVLVEEGASVSAGDVIVIMESMKLEIPVEAPAAGKVIELKVKEGDAITEGTLIAVIDDG